MASLVWKHSECSVVISLLDEIKVFLNNQRHENDEDLTKIFSESTNSVNLRENALI